MLLVIPWWHCPMNTRFIRSQALQTQLPCHQPAWSTCHTPEERRDALRAVLQRDTGLIQSLERLACPPTGHGSQAG